VSIPANIRERKERIKEEELLIEMERIEKERLEAAYKEEIGINNRM